MSIVTKGKIFRQDMEHWDGISKTANRKDSTGGTVSGLVVGHEVDVLATYGNGENYTWQTVNDCTRRIGSASCTLIFNPGTWTIDQNLTIGSNFTCRIPAGCVFSVSSGITLTFSGPVIRDSSTWTSGSGTVTESGTRTFTGLIDLTGAVIQGTNALVFEGATANAFETTFVITDPTADRTVTIPDADVDLSSIPSLSGNNTFTGNNTLSGISTFSGTIAGASPLVFEGATANDFETTLAITDPTADRTVTVADATFTIGPNKVVTTTHDVSVTGTQAITGVGFKPTSVTIVANINSTSNCSWGMSDGTTNECIANTSGTFSGLAVSSACIDLIQTVGSVFAIAVVTTFDTDGLTLTWSKTGSPTGTANLKILCHR